MWASQRINLLLAFSGLEGRVIRVEARELFDGFWQ